MGEDIYVYVDRRTRKINMRNFRHKLKLKMLLLVETILYCLKWAFPRTYYSFRDNRLHMDRDYWKKIAAEITELMDLMRENTESSWKQLEKGWNLES